MGRGKPCYPTVHHEIVVKMRRRVKWEWEDTGDEEKETMLLKILPEDNNDEEDTGDDNGLI